MLVKKISMIILRVADVELCLQFYQLLGFSLVFHREKTWAELSIDTMKLGLYPVEGVQGTRTGIVLEVLNMEELTKALGPSTPLLNGPQQEVYGIIASIQDPAGNIIDLFQPTSEKLRHYIDQFSDAKICSTPSYSCDRKANNKCCC